MTCGTYVKDLNILSEIIEVKNILLLDNLAACYSQQIDNGIPIIPYESVNFHDKELLILIKYLRNLSKAKIIRKFNRKHLQLKRIQNCKSWEEVKGVYLNRSES